MLYIYFYPMQKLLLFQGEFVQYTVVLSFSLLQTRFPAAVRLFFSPLVLPWAFTLRSSLRLYLESTSRIRNFSCPSLYPTCFRHE